MDYDLAFRIIVALASAAFTVMVRGIKREMKALDLQIELREKNLELRVLGIINGLVRESMQKQLDVLIWRGDSIQTGGTRSPDKT